MALKGLQQVTKNLNDEIKQIKNRSLKGLIRGSIIIIRDTELSPPKTPVDLGNLRASRFTVNSQGLPSPLGKETFTGEKASGLSNDHAEVIAKSQSESKKHKDPNVIFGFTANYAMPVHESVGKNFNRPGSGAKFFESSLKSKQKEVLEVIAKEAKIK